MWHRAQACADLALSGHIIYRVEEHRDAISSFHFALLPTTPTTFSNDVTPDKARRPTLLRQPLLSPSPNPLQLAIVGMSEEDEYEALSPNAGLGVCQSHASRSQAA